MKLIYYYFRALLILCIYIQDMSKSLSPPGLNWWNALCVLLLLFALGYCMDYYKSYNFLEGYANNRNNPQPSTATFFTRLYTTFAKICRQVIMQPYNIIYSIFAFPIRIYRTVIGHLTLQLFFFQRYLRSLSTTISNFQKKMSSITWTVLDFLMQLPVRIFRKLNSFI